MTEPLSPVRPAASAGPEVTIVVVPRERFSCAEESLEDLYRNTNTPFRLVYVDTNSPAPVASYLKEQAAKRQFRLIRSNYFLTPTQARNIGLEYADTKYVVFVDNDTLFSPGWLDQLVACAEETGAAVVGPLVCHHEPPHQIIHCAGGQIMPEESLSLFRGFVAVSHQADCTRPRLTIQECIYKQDRRVADELSALKREETGFIEFHCILVRRSVLDRIGPFDEQMICTKEHLDFCLRVQQAGEKVILEPSSIVTFLTHPGPRQLSWSDLSYYMFRWSYPWQMSTLKHFCTKWNFDGTNYISEKYSMVRWRRRSMIIRPLAEKWAFLGKYGVRSLEELLLRVDRVLNPIFVMWQTHRIKHATVIEVSAGP